VKLLGRKRSSGPADSVQRNIGAALNVSVSICSRIITKGNSLFSDVVSQIDPGLYFKNSFF
jgi:hypothetical protein